MKKIIRADELSSAFCDLSDIRGSLKRRKGLDCFGEVKKFLESLHADSEVEIDPDNLKSCIKQLKTLSIDKKTLSSSKDDENSDFTIEDCLNDVVAFLKSLEG